MASACGEVEPQAGVDGPAVVHHAPPRVGRDLAGQRDRGGEGLPVGDDPVEEAHPLGFLGADLSPGEDQVEGPAQPDDLGQSVGPAVDQRNPPAPLQAADPRRRARDP